MLYITTRNDTDAFTHPRTLINDRAADGGFYTPFRLPVFTQQELNRFKNCSFGEAVARVLNLFFGSELESSDVDFSIGRVPIKILPVKYRMVVCETWRNPDADYRFMVKQLNARICPDAKLPSALLELAVRIAVYFGIYGQMLAQGLVQDDDSFDIAVAANNYMDMTAVHYAKQMGLPVGMMICGCEKDILWNLIHRGEVSTKSLSTEEKDCIEHLLYGKLGCRSVREFLDCCEDTRPYSVTEPQRKLLSEGIFVAVVTHNRMDSVISSVYKTNGYIIDRERVFPYAALQDYRTGAGESRLTLFCADVTPANDHKHICAAVGISQQQLSEAIN